MGSVEVENDIDKCGCDNDNNNDNDNDNRLFGKEKDVKSDDDVENDFKPTTVLIMLGSMHFDSACSADTLSLKIENPEEMLTVLEEACNQIRPNSLKKVHILIKSSSISTLFDESILTAFHDGLLPGMDGVLMVHVLPVSTVMAEDMAVQPGDVDSIRMSLVLTSFFLESEEEQDGSWVLTARKSKPTQHEVEEEVQNERQDLDNKQQV
mmetsp:Transcript_49323/g.55123  ORF Transcript_49323/g.55123 Transcript_49323/m.55123 type:complete len:209 (+) Transcript_49323:61-687(+)